MLGVFSFAISGVLVASDQRFDLFGTLILAFVTAHGGGTLRDVLLNQTPVSWMRDLYGFWIVLLTLPICYFWQDRILRMRKTFFLFDTIGLSLFTIVGIQQTLAFDLSPVIALIMGVVSAVFGGVIRDILAGKKPLVFQKEVYATCCLLGGMFYMGLEHLWGHRVGATLLSMALIVGLRIYSVMHELRLPVVIRR